MAIFEVSGSSDPLNLWDASPQAVSFGIGDEAVALDDAPVYRVNLSGGGETASSALDGQLARLRQMKATLDDIPARLDDLTGRGRRKEPGAGGGVSFAALEETSQEGPEGELLALLAYSDATALGRPGPEGVSFGLGETAGQALSRAKARFLALLEQLDREILHFAWVETKIEGLIIARSKMGWIGDSNTAWKGLTPAEHMHLHHKTLEVVSQTRNQKLRLSLTVLTSAAKVAVLMTAPGGAMLALPAVYEYTLKILEQANQLREIKAPKKAESPKGGIAV
jgi:hypothetical protein